MFFWFPGSINGSLHGFFIHRALHCSGALQHGCIRTNILQELASTNAACGIGKRAFRFHGGCHGGCRAKNDHSFLLSIFVLGWP